MAKGKFTGGRKKGVPNKVTGALKDMILQALADSGGVDYLKSQAAANPTAFLSLVGKVLPLQIKESNDDPKVPPTTVNHIYETVLK